MPRCASAGGTDSAGYAGLAADLRTFAAFGCHGSMVVTSVTVQSTTEVRRVFPMPPALVAEQLETILEDPGVEALVVGLVPTVEIVEVLAGVLEAAEPRPQLVVDPIVAASTGAEMSGKEVSRALAGRLLPLARVATPNRRELEALAGEALPDEGACLAAARRLLEAGTGAVLLTGGDREGDPEDLLVTAEGVERMRVVRAPGPGTRGGGCTHAAALAALLARGTPLPEAARLAQRYLAACARAAVAPGAGEGRVVQVVPPWALK
ncbi:MAG: hydroxymethylpyrimidine/phosphomethylpyrimidine kinase [Deltaproteobacteria bacterium]|nr:hydroxymethylpyrimidine/phosphomethylpyrimidine kinase [Deltaproteobacteria bacterium]